MVLLVAIHTDALEVWRLCWIYVDNVTTCYDNQPTSKTTRSKHATSLCQSPVADYGSETCPGEALQQRNNWLGDFGRGRNRPHERRIQVLVGYCRISTFLRQQHASCSLIMISLFVRGQKVQTQWEEDKRTSINRATKTIRWHDRSWTILNGELTMLELLNIY